MGVPQPLEILNLFGPQSLSGDNGDYVVVQLLEQFLQES